MSNTICSIDVEFPTDDGGVETKTLHFKSLAEIPIGIVRRTRNDNTEQMWQAFEWAYAPDELALFDALEAKDVLAVLAKMQEASKVDLGESSASPTS